jgi:hypothetical protein
MSLLGKLWRMCQMVKVLKMSKSRFLGKAQVDG